MELPHLKSNHLNISHNFQLAVGIIICQLVLDLSSGDHCIDTSQQSHFLMDLLSDIVISSIIKYSILTEVRLSFILNNFVRLSGEPIIPELYSGNLTISSISRTSVKNTRTSLQRFQRSPAGKSHYIPLPRGFNPYKLIAPKPGSETRHLPPFTDQLWSSQFTLVHPPTQNMSRQQPSTSNQQRSASSSRPSTKNEDELWTN